MSHKPRTERHTRENHIRVTRAQMRQQMQQAQHNYESGDSLDQAELMQDTLDTGPTR